MSKVFDIKNFSFEEILKNKTYDSNFFEESYNYDKNDLGVTLKNFSTIFKLWAPVSSKVILNLYKTGNGSDSISSYEMNKEENGIFSITIDENLEGLYYTFVIYNFGKSYEIVDPYAKAVGVNGKRGLIIDLSKTNPENWDNDKFVYLENKTDAIIYEIHIRDFSVCENSGMKYKGKFLSFTEKDTKNSFGDSTGISHLKELGITHVQVLPVFDFASIDEENINSDIFNWGYDPLNYNCLEGSYSTNPFDGSVRITEFKRLIQSLHNENIGFIMDVVYNHTHYNENSYLNKCVPKYYHRCDEKGNFTNGSGCGNEIASERLMVRKMILDSLVYLTKEFHIDGFRFDLMGLMDIRTMNEIEKTLRCINPSILLYGEGWIPGKSPLDINSSSVKSNAKYLSSNIAMFSDDMRDSIRGPISNKKLGGFVSNIGDFNNNIKFGIVASGFHRQIDYSFISDPWTSEPSQCINYESCHDDETLFDRLEMCNKGLPEIDLISMNKMAITLILTSQGISFIHGGEEFLRKKRDSNGKIFHNTYNLSDSINMINWNDKSLHKDLFTYYKNLIKLRRLHPAFRIPSNELINSHLEFVEMNNPNCVGYFIKNYKLDNWKNIGVFFNSGNENIIVNLYEKNWVIVVDKYLSGIEELSHIDNGKLNLTPKSHFIIVDEKSFNAKKGLY